MHAGNYNSKVSLLPWGKEKGILLRNVVKPRRLIVPKFVTTRLIMNSSIKEDHSGLAGVVEMCHK